MLPSKGMIFRKIYSKIARKHYLKRHPIFYKKGRDILSFFVPTVLAAGAIFHARKPNVVARLGAREINGFKIFLK